MGTTSRTLNLFNRLFKGPKAAPKQALPPQGYNRAEMRKQSRKSKRRRSVGDTGVRLYHGRARKGNYMFGGGHGFNPQAIFIPRKQYKGYIKDAMSNNTFNKNK